MRIDEVNESELALLGCFDSKLVGAGGLGGLADLVEGCGLAVVMEEMRGPVSDLLEEAVEKGLDEVVGAKDRGGDASELD